MQKSHRLIMQELRIHQLGQDSPLMMRFVSLAERRKRGYGQPQKSEYILVYEGEARKFDLEAVWEKFGRKAPSDRIWKICRGKQAEKGKGQTRNIYISGIYTLLFKE